MRKGRRKTTRAFENNDEIIGRHIATLISWVCITVVLVALLAAGIASLLEMHNYFFLIFSLLMLVVTIVGILIAIKLSPSNNK